MLRNFFCALLLLFCVSRAFAEDVSFEATVNASKVPMGTAAEFVLTLHGTQDLDQVKLPPIDGFEVRFVGPSTQVSVVNGVYSAAKAFTYMLLPLKEGMFTIPSVDVVVKGQTYSTKPLALQVVSSTAAGEAPADPSEAPETMAEHIKLRISVPRTRCYVG
ncbi:MAG: BatD family protein, partial [Candidatus Omnitrophica bacterium]|nr:BatD family protein [Candidatus Omnitrophota bacterium]